MRIIYIKLINFIGIKAAMGLSEFELSFDRIDKPIIQIYGPNRCGKTVLIHELHPFSSINLNGDERSDLSLIIPGEVGIKNIVYEVDGEVYNITHTYKPTPSGNHTVSSSIMSNDKELNPSGGVNVFNNLIEKLLGINKYVFQFIINGTQLTSFANMGATQRKTLLNKAMGIDIYDKIHKMATEDYRYTNKLIMSLNNTKEFLLSTYGSYDNLCALLSQKRDEYNAVTQAINSIKSRMDSLTGTISTIRQQNVNQELHEVQSLCLAYKNAVSELGEFDGNMYDRLVDEQISLNDQISSLRNQRLLIMKDIDVLYGKKQDIENTILANKKAIADRDELCRLRDSLKSKISDIVISVHVTSSSNYMMSMISLAQVINSSCKEIVTCLNEKHLVLFADMIEKGIDISAFLVKEGSVLMDSEKEKSVISRIRNMINSIDGEYVDDCCYTNCIYRKTQETLETYFKSYQSATSSSFTTYDIEQFDHAYKNVQTIKRLINPLNISDELKDIFDIRTIMRNISNGKLGIDVAFVQHLMEEAAKIEMRNKYISQLADVEQQLTSMSNLLTLSDDVDETLECISKEIEVLKSKISDLEIQIDGFTDSLSRNDKHRMMLSQVQHVNIKDLEKRQTKLMELIAKLSSSESEYSTLFEEYNNMQARLSIIVQELETLDKANSQYIDTSREIERHMLSDAKYKVIAEATSSTKGKPVIAIRDNVENALMMTNRLLNVMYDGEIEMLQPTIDETSFTLPFRCGMNKSEDIRYGSQSESTLLSLALSLSLASSLTRYKVPLIDEIDAYLDTHIRDGFVLMLQEIMSTLKMEQLFLISHNIQPGQYGHIVHTIDLAKEIIRGGE